MTDLTTTYLGLELTSPLVASASPLTGRIDTLVRLAAAGAAAVVLPSLFEEDVVAAALDRQRLFTQGTEAFAEALTLPPGAGRLPTRSIGTCSSSPRPRRTSMYR